MFLCYAFIGKLPFYIVDTIHQARCFFDGDIYLIIDQLESPFVIQLQKYNVKIVDYNDVKSDLFKNVFEKNENKFCIVHGLTGREKLFIYSFERFFILQNLMKKFNLHDCLFLELDNLIYYDSLKWVEQFSKSELCYMYDNDDRCSSGIMYVKDGNSLEELLNYMLTYIENCSNELLNEMTVLYRYFRLKKNVQILPTYWVDNALPNEAYQNYNFYNETIFDAAAIGVYLLGNDPYHTNGIIIRNVKNVYSKIDYTNCKFEWKLDDLGRKKPFIWNGEKWLLINNLHIHSKDLKSGLSTDI